MTWALPLLVASSLAMAFHESSRLVEELEAQKEKTKLALQAMEHFKLSAEQCLRAKGVLP